MSKLKSVKKVVFEVDYSDLNNFIEENYGGSYEFVAQEECGNDSSHSFTVTKEDEDEDVVNGMKIRKGEYGYTRTHEVLTCLCNDGLIEEGNYIIDVCW